MKILQINSGTMVNGTLTYCKFLSSEIAKLGHEVTIAARPSSWLINNIPFQVRAFPFSLSRSPKQLRKLAKWIRESEFDVIHTHMSRANSLGVLMKMMTGVPVVATAHACSLQLHWPLNDYVLANSESTFQYYNRLPWSMGRKLKTVHCFTGLERFKSVEPINVLRVRRQLKLKGDEFVVGLVGEVVYRKGHQFLFEAMSKIIAAVPNFKLVLIGRFHRNEAFVRRLRKIQMTNGLFRRVKWLGFRYNVEDFMSAFDLCVVPSLQESLGLVALEASAAGTPVIASNVGGLPEVVQHNENGALVPPRSSDALADSIIRLARNKDERERMGEAGRQLVENRFNPQKLALEVLKTYELVISQQRAERSAA